MCFVWFWTFWHWSKENFRGGSLLRSPLHGVGSHWDEWFCHEVSESDLRAAALVVRPEFDAFVRLDVLPQVGGYVLARTVVEGTRK